MKEASDTGENGIEKRPTGVQGLDELLAGGLPAGRTTLVAGGPGAGKTMLTLQALDDRVMMTPALRVSVQRDESWFFGDLAHAEPLGDMLERVRRERSDAW